MRKALTGQDRAELINTVLNLGNTTQGQFSFAARHLETFSDAHLLIKKARYAHQRLTAS